MKYAAVKDIIASFNHPILPIVQGEPDYQKIHVIRKLLQANARAIDTHLGGGALGHPGLIVSDTSYAMVYPATEDGPTLWVNPTAPGWTPGNTDGTAAKIRAARHSWEEAVHTYCTCTSVQDALKKQIINVFEPMYLDILNDDMVGFANITDQEMLDHLFITYGNITDVDLENNFEQMRRAWDPQQPVESLFKQIQDCADYYEAVGVIIGHPQQINVGFFFFATGHFMSACRRWNEKPSVEKTWAQFKTHFAAAHRQRKQMHKAMFIPTKSALLQAVKNGHLITWPGLTQQAINKHLKLTPATTMGHMNQHRQNIRSTSKTPINADMEDEQVKPAGLGTKTHLFNAVVVDQCQLYTDLTGRFSVRSSKGNWYIMVRYAYDCNYINVVPMRSISASEWVKYYDHIHQELTAKGFKPKLQTLDNKASAALKSFFTTNDVDYQLVPPHCHRRITAERAVRTFKENFVAGLASVDPDFPLHLWNRLLPQAELTLNILRTSRQHPQLSAAAHYHGLVDYNKTAFAPTGCNIIAHEKPANRRTWAPHVQHGYALGPAMHHYRFQNVYISATASERIVDTLEFFPHNSPMPQLSSTDRLLVAANDISNTLKHSHPEAPFSHIRDDTITALTQLDEIKKNKFQKSKSPELTHSPIKAAENKRPSVLTQPLLAFPVKNTYQTRSQKTLHTTTTSNTPLLPRVITPMTGRTASPRVPARTQNLSPRNLSQDDFWSMGTTNMAVALGTNNWYQQHFANEVVHPITGKQMEYMALMNGPDLQPLWKRGFNNKAGCLFQGIHDIPGTNTCSFVELKNIPKDRKITYGKIVCDYKPHKKRKGARHTHGGRRQTGLLRRRGDLHC
jgi:hypothetical protein